MKPGVLNALSFFGRSCQPQSRFMSFESGTPQSRRCVASSRPRSHRPPAARARTRTSRRRAWLSKQRRAFPARRPCAESVAAGAELAQRRTKVARQLIDLTAAGQTRDGAKQRLGAHLLPERMTGVDRPAPRLDRAHRHLAGDGPASFVRLCSGPASAPGCNPRLQSVATARARALKCGQRGM